MNSNVNQYNRSFSPVRKRDNQGNFADSNTRDIFVPFKCEVPAGTSTFDIMVPITFLNRIYSFDNVMLILNMYALQAQIFNEETEEELKEYLSYNIAFQVTFLSEKKNLFYGPVYEMPTEIKMTDELTKQINKYFELNKPSGIVSTPIFFDWIDLRFEKVTDKTFDEYYQSMARTYYGEEFDVSKHWNALPRSARKVFGVNNYLLPTLLTGDVLDNIRLRINIAPNTLASFSTNLYLLCMGFDAGQIGNRKRITDNFVYKNSSISHYREIQCNNKIIPELIVTPNKFKLFAQVIEKNYFSAEYNLQITKRDAMKNEKFEEKLKTAFLEYEKFGNISFGVNYNPSAKRFSFLFPKNNKMINMKIVIDPDLAERIGFEMNREITPSRNKGEELVEFDPKETEERARALSHETGLIIVSHHNPRGTNTTVGMSEQYMAALYPTETGNMLMHVNEICNEKPFFMLPPTSTISMTAPLIPITFLLSRFSDNSELVNLIWKEGFTMQGTLRGVHPLKITK